MTPEVSQSFERFAAPERMALLAVRELILTTAEELEVGPLTEALRWGEPAFLTEATKSGTTIRLGTPKNKPGHCAIFVHCQTSLVAEFREVIDDPSIEFEGNRAVVFPAGDRLPKAALQHVIAQALTYKRR